VFWLFDIRICERTAARRMGGAAPSAAVRRAKAEAIPIICCTEIDGFRERLNPSYGAVPDSTGGGPGING
jgi:hypothetical protein